MRNTRKIAISLCCLPLLAVVVVSGCESPLRPDTPEDIHRNLIASVDREIRTLKENQPSLITKQPESRIEETLAPRMDELKKMAGPDSYTLDEPDMKLDLTGKPQAVVGISLEQAIAIAIDNNLSTQIARLQPNITEQDVIEAEAAFDAVFFTNVDHNKTDEPRTTPVLGGIPLGTPVSLRENTIFETGIRKRLNYGSELTVSTRLDRLRDKSPGFALSPDPAYTSRIILGITQPLLRGFGTDVNQAQIYLAQNNDQKSIQELKKNLLELVQATENAYWDLVVARRALLIQQRLLERGIEVRDLLERRQIRGDVLQAELADAIATVERRRANVIRATRRIRATSDNLKVLVNEPGLSIGSESLLQPMDFMVETPVEYNLREAIMTAIQERPEVMQAAIKVNDASIGVTVAENAKLPLLNASARMEAVGLDDTTGESYDQAGEGSFVDYFLSLALEYPIGNREADAGFRRARLQQTAAVISYKNTVQQVVLDVKSALRDVVTNYELIQAARVARIAQTENLRAFEARDANEPLSVTRLNLKFSRQEGLALEEISELTALANFNKAVATLYRAMGIGLAMNGIDFHAQTSNDN